MKYIFILMIILFGITGCAPLTEVQMYSEREYPPTNPSLIEVFEQKPVDREFKEIGEVMVEYAEDMADVRKVFRQKASGVGGDAVYMLRRDYIQKVRYAQRPVLYPGFYDYYGYHYRYGRHHWGYRYDYPNGFYRETDVLINATGIIIKYTD